MALVGPRTRSWTRAEYDRMIAHGLFRAGERMELLGGELVAREPQGAAHATGIRMAEEALRGAFGPGWEVRVQMPVALDDRSEPEPDVAVVPGSFRDYRHAHPARPVLIVEVADATLAFDRHDKAGLYARAGVPECWIVNLVDHVLEVLREPVLDDAAPAGARYRHREVLSTGQVVSPGARPGTWIAVADLIP